MTLAKFHSVAHMKATVSNSGSHFFDSATNRFFGSRFGTALVGGSLVLETQHQAYEGKSYRMVGFLPYYGRGIHEDVATPRVTTRAQALKDGAALLKSHE